jgi:hypothetical protein
VSRSCDIRPIWLELGSYGSVPSVSTPPALLIEDYYKLHRPLSRREVRCHVVGLTAGRHKVHVAIRNANEGRHVAMAPDRGRVRPWSVVLDRADENCQEWSCAKFR